MSPYAAGEVDFMAISFVEMCRPVRERRAARAGRHAVLLRESELLRLERGVPRRRRDAALPPAWLSLIPTESRSSDSR
jgi:hypothetical protein